MIRKFVFCSLLLVLSGCHNDYSVFNDGDIGGDLATNPDNQCVMKALTYSGAQNVTTKDPTANLGRSAEKVGAYSVLTAFELFAPHNNLSVLNDHKVDQYFYKNGNFLVKVKFEHIDRVVSDNVRRKLKIVYDFGNHKPTKDEVGNAIDYTNLLDDNISRECKLHITRKEVNCWNFNHVADSCLQ